MIISEFTKVAKNAKNHKHYTNLGYVESDGFFFVRVSDLTKSSRSVIKAICDYCGREKDITYKEYSRNISFGGKFSCCNKCASFKKKELSIIKYGVDSPSKIEEIKKKNRETNLVKFGSEFFFLTKEFKEKSAQTKISKFGTDNLMSLESIKDKIKKTNLEKYGVENPFQSDEIKLKIIEANIEKYGVPRYQSTDEFKMKFKSTSLSKYGVESPMMVKEISEKSVRSHIEKYGMYFTKTKDFLEKVKRTCQSKYGVDFPMQNPIFLEKAKATNITNLGVEFPMMSDFVREKSKKTFSSKYGAESLRESDYYRSLNFRNCMDVNYIGYLGDKVSEYTCELGHVFKIDSSVYNHRIKGGIKVCTICNPKGLRSASEIEVYNFLGTIYSGEILLNYRQKFEIDIYLPELRIGFEFNGLYWHSNIFKKNRYHLDKTEFFEKIGIRIIHIWEDSWSKNKDIIKSQIRNILGKSNRIFARNCHLVEIDSRSSKDFLEKNHIQGYTNCDINIGVFYSGEMVGIMSFNKFEGRNRMPEGEWNLARYCSSIGSAIIGGPSKCLKYFFRHFSPKRIVTYADRDWSNGNLYEVLGFDLIGMSNPDYKYVINGTRVHKSNFTKSKISKKFGENLDNISENEFLRGKGIYRIYDCGKIKYEMNINKLENF